MNSHSNIIDNPLTAGFMEQLEIKYFVDSINEKVSFKIKSKVDNLTKLDGVNAEFKESDEFSRHKLVFRKDNVTGFFSKTQKWMGHVIEINDNTFNAKLEDLTTVSGTYEIGEFEMEEISLEDKELVQVGAAFYWSIGYSHEYDGQISKKSLIRFQRMVKWDDAYLNKVSDRAESLSKTLNWD